MTHANHDQTAANVFRKGKREPVDIQPTYPLDLEKIKSLRELAVLDSPKLLVWQLLAQLGSRFTLLSRFANSWAEVEPQLSDAVVDHVVKQSNAAQNYVVNSLIQVLRDIDFPVYADMLCKFLFAKQSIEYSLQSNVRLASQRADVETLVDSIMQEVCNEIFVLTDLETELTESLTLPAHAGEERIEALRQGIKNSQERIGRAFDTINETEKQTTFQQPPRCETTKSDIPESLVLDRLIDALREENDVAKTVNDRIQAELPSYE